MNDNKTPIELLACNQLQLTQRLVAAENKLSALPIGDNLDCTIQALAQLTSRTRRIEVHTACLEDQITNIKHHITQLRGEMQDLEGRITDRGRPESGMRGSNKRPSITPSLSALNTKS